MIVLKYNSVLHVVKKIYGDFHEEKKANSSIFFLYLRTHTQKKEILIFIQQKYLEKYFFILKKN